MSFLFDDPVSASEVRAPASQTVPCGVLEKFEGDVQILDATRDQLVETRMDAKIPCGAWITVSAGWVKVVHRQGYLIKAGSETFFELYDNERSKHMTGEDHIVLYRGRIYFKAKKGTSPIRLVTANARNRIDWGTVLFSFNRSKEESQLVVLENEAHLENRFEPSRIVRVKRGEAASLNFKGTRVLPSTPRALKIAALKKQLDQIPLNTKEFKMAIDAARKRKDRKLASKLVSSEKKTRKPSSQKMKGKHSYKQFKPYSEDDVAYREWKKKLIGGIEKDLYVFYPYSDSGRGPASISSQEFARKIRVKNINKKKLEEEKRKLLEELSGR